ncbi:MAG: trigger factor [Saprospiraceae bacterium]
MPQVVREDIDNLNAVLTVSIPTDDYLPSFNTELQKYRKDARIKGFRQGKTPTGVLKKMFGKAVLGDVINKILQKELSEYLADDKLEILGQPIPSDTQEQVSFDVRELHDFSFKFDIGLSPQFEVQGLDGTFEKYVVTIGDEQVEEEVQNLLLRNSEQVFPEEDIQEKDIITLEITEVDGDAPKTDGVSHEFGVLVERLLDEVKEAVLHKGLGHRLTINPFELEKDTTEKYARKYFLGLTDEDEREVGHTFEAEITKISRAEKASLNQTFFDKVFGPEVVSTEEDFRTKLREDIANSYTAQSEALLFRDIQKVLLEQNALQLPDAFLKRWLSTSNENLAEETLEKEYPAFAENLKWTLIRSKLNKSFDIEVTPEEIKETFKNKIRSYFGGAPSPEIEPMIESMAERMLKDEKQLNELYEEVSSNKFFDAVVAQVAVVDKPISLEDFQAVIQQIEAERQAGNAAETEEE